MPNYNRPRFIKPIPPPYMNASMHPPSTRYRPTSMSSSRYPCRPPPPPPPLPPPLRPSHSPTWDTNVPLHYYPPTGSTPLRMHRGGGGPPPSQTRPIYQQQHSLLQHELSSDWSMLRQCPPPSQYPAYHYTQQQQQQQQQLQQEPRQIFTYEPDQNTIESIFNSWLNYYEPIFIERRRHSKEVNSIEIPMYRNMLIKWSELIKSFQTIDEQTAEDSSTSSSLSLQQELHTIQEKCTNPHIISLVEKKLGSIRKKRRYLKRVRERKRNLDLQLSPVIVETTTGSILQRLKSDMLASIELPKDGNFNDATATTTNTSSDQDTKKHPIDDEAGHVDDGDRNQDPNRLLLAGQCATDERCKTPSHIDEESPTKNKDFSSASSPISPSSSTKRIIDKDSNNNNNTHRNCNYHQMETILSKSIDECKTRIKLLDSLHQLRSARLTQAKQQGGLFPHQIDEVFTFNINELKSLLSDQIQSLETTHTKVKDILRHQENLKSKSNYNSLSQSQGNCCIHVPNLPKQLQIELFGNQCTNNISDIQQRWQRFYHQADYNFCDFIRIRYAWDKYLKMDTNTNEANDDDNIKDYELPKQWILPEINNNAEEVEKKEDGIDKVKDTLAKDDINSMNSSHCQKDKWSKYLRSIH
ncbi:unnamed protein product [Trichobilharzia szidati]|nr:unnamed protein product [Trichobilharzia szidati]